MPCLTCSHGCMHAAIQQQALQQLLPVPAHCSVSTRQRWCMRLWVGCPQASTVGQLVTCLRGIDTRTCPVLQLLEDAKHRQAHIHWQNKVAAWQSVLATMFPAMAVSDFQRFSGVSTASIMKDVGQASACAASGPALAARPTTHVPCACCTRLAAHLLSALASHMHNPHF